VTKKNGRGKDGNQTAAQSLLQLHKLRCSLWLSCRQPFTTVKDKERAAILCASLKTILLSNLCYSTTPFCTKDSGSVIRNSIGAS
jgi:hypothetical protein